VRPLVVVQARMGSSRMPGKVLEPLAGAPLLQRMLERLRAARTPLTVCVATTTDEADDPIAELCASIRVDCFRGHPTDLLDRHYRCAKARRARTVLKIPSDCPLIDPAVIDRVMAAWDETELDYLSNLHPATYPDGNDVEVMTMAALEVAFEEASRPLEREHTTPFLWERPERFRLGNVTWETGFSYAMSHRFTIDWPDDYRFIAAIYDALWSADAVFGLDEILELLRLKPELMALNGHLAGVNWYRHHLDELKTVSVDETRHLDGRTNP